MAQMPEAIILRKTEETKTGVTYCMADVKTNADRIRSMSDEELAEFVIGVLCYTKLPYMEVREKAVCDNELLDWLKEEAKDV